LHKGKTVEIFVSSLDRVYSTICSRGITHVLTLLKIEERQYLRLPGFFDRSKWLFLEMDDVIDRDAYSAPKKDQVDHLLNWGRKLPSDARLLVHCLGGVSRSTAAALALKVQDKGLDSIDESLAWLVAIRPIACPNPVITIYADELLNADGKLFKAVEKMVRAKLIADRR
jgi:predicted protein tyrosine phosphatase